MPPAVLLELDRVLGLATKAERPALSLLAPRSPRGFLGSRMVINRYKIDPNHNIM